VFHRLRNQQGLNTEQYLRSFRISQLDDKMNEKFSEGKSGSVFLVSEDNHFVLTKITHAESSFLRRIVPQYFHVTRYQK
jgi:hypothetical protein